jgi:hypothetical protein
VEGLIKQSSPDEITDIVSALSQWKAPAFNGITNEMLKKLLPAALKQLSCSRSSSISLDSSPRDGKRLLW